MLPILVTFVAVTLLAFMSVRANRQFLATERWPMQWSGQGQVNWTAPRVFALAIIPTLATLILCAACLSFIFLPSRPGQESMIMPAMLILAIVPLGIHHFHITLIARHLSKAGD